MNILTPDQRAALQASLEQRKFALLRQFATRPNSDAAATAGSRGWTTRRARRR